MNQRRSLKELNLLDKFLFDEAMDDPENVKTMLDIILSQNMMLKHPPQTEKEQRTSTDNRQIRLDVYAMDEDDGATRIFLNTRGEHPELVSPELIELLKYMEHSTDEVSGSCESKRIQEMHRRVCQIKASEKTEVKYMQTWEEKILIKQEGIREGIAEGEKRLLVSQIQKKLAKNYSAEQISEILEIDISQVENIIEEIQNEKAAEE
ncbi:hypothetical protein [Dorea sp.]